MAPLNLQSAYDTYKTEHSIPGAVGSAALGSIGFGLGSYPDKKATSGSRYDSFRSKASSTSKYDSVRSSR